MKKEINFFNTTDKVITSVINWLLLLLLVPPHTPSCIWRATSRQ